MNMPEHKQTHMWKIQRRASANKHVRARSLPSPSLSCAPAAPKDRGISAKSPPDASASLPVPSLPVCRLPQAVIPPRPPLSSLSLSASSAHSLSLSSQSPKQPHQTCPVSPRSTAPAALCQLSHRCLADPITPPPPPTNRQRLSPQSLDAVCDLPESHDLTRSSLSNTHTHS